MVYWNSRFIVVPDYGRFMGCFGKWWSTHFLALQLNITYLRYVHMWITIVCPIPWAVSCEAHQFEHWKHLWAQHTAQWCTLSWYISNSSLTTCGLPYIGITWTSLSSLKAPWIILCLVKNLHSNPNPIPNSRSWHSISIIFAQWKLHKVAAMWRNTYNYI